MRRCLSIRGFVDSKILEEWVILVPFFGPGYLAFIVISHVSIEQYPHQNRVRA